ncbi:MAG: divergent polysaccharide deacetylase family protein [Magnetococcales bacterium]|nr:divergent polysaccharide deacetylase family protein [Magnetococcales bacterium]
MEDSKEGQPIGKKPILGLALTFLGVLLVPAVIVFLGWKSLSPILDVGDDPSNSNIAVNEQAVNNSSGSITTNAQASDAVSSKVEVASLSGKAVADSVSAVGDTVSTDGTLTGNTYLGGSNKVVVKGSSQKPEGISSALSSAISSVVESGSAISTEKGLNLDKSKFKPRKQPVDKSAGADGVQKASLQLSPKVSQLKDAKIQLDKPQLKSAIKAAKPAVADVVTPPHTVDKSIVYEEHFVEDLKYPEPNPLVAPPKPTYRKKAKLRLALIIDDLGYNSWVSKSISRLPADITLAVLPGGIASHDVVSIAEKTGKELILHQPMQPRGYPRVKPGPKALLDGMGPEKIRRVLLDNLAEFKTAVGINNHMGSLLTTKSAAMDVVMEVLAEEKLFFVDSRTSTNTVAESRAKARGVPTIRRDVFIDNNQDKASILKQLYLLETLAHSGPVVGIGHPYPGTLAALKEWLPTLEEKGIVLARVSQLLFPVSARSLYPNLVIAEPVQ